MKKKTKSKPSEKFSFSLEFQTEILRYFIQAREGVLIMPKIKPGYFTLIEHSIIYEALHKAIKRYKRIPGQAVVIETMKAMLTSRDYVDLLTKDDIPQVTTLIKSLYSNPLKDEDIIKENIFRFHAYLEVKALNEVTDFTDFDQFEAYQEQFSKILRSSKPVTDNDEPLYMVDGTVSRQLIRKISPDVIPSPFRQLNDLTNGGGFPKGSIIVLLDKAKAKKTFMLINAARGYLAMRKNVLYVDLENGKSQIMERMVQSTLGRTKREMLTGEQDMLEKRHMRKYKRMGVEFVVEKLPAKVADANHLKALIQKVEAEKGIKVHILMLDYAAKMASISRDRDDFERISNIYIDIANLADEIGLEHIWTANHVQRSAMKRKQTRYEEDDIALCIDIIRHAQVIYGLNSTEEEEQNHIFRTEVVVQRDGKPHGRALFHMDVEKQRMKEFTREQRQKYDETVGAAVDQMMETEGEDKGPRKRPVNPNADKDKRAKKTGDI